MKICIDSDSSLIFYTRPKLYDDDIEINISADRYDWVYDTMQEAQKVQEYLRKHYLG